MTEKQPPDTAHRWTWERAVRDRAAKEGMKPSEQHIALLLATYADPMGDGIFPSITTICQASGKGRSAVNEALKGLRESGWIKQVQRGNNIKGRSGSSRYVLAIPPAKKSGQPDTNKPV